VLHSDAHVDHSPYDVYAALLDEGRYLASIRSFYRVLEANGETAARSDQRRSTGPRPVPVLCARGAKEIWSWDIERHEAPWNRAVVKGHGRRLVAASQSKLRAA
jgi:putative transposase